MKLRLPLVSVLAALSLVVFFLGCNNTFRPVVNPLPQPGGVPSQLKFIFVLSSTGLTSSSPGVLSALDVSGDTDIAEMVLGHGVSSMGLGTGGNIVYAVNQADSSISTINGFVPNSTTPLTLTQSVTGLPTGILCPAVACVASNPVVAAGNFVYVAQAAPSSGGTGQGKVFIFSQISGLSLSGQIPIGKPTPNPTPASPPPLSAPIAMVSASVVGKVYFLNGNTNDLTSWSSESNLVQTASIPVGNNPVSAIVNEQGNRLFVLNSGDSTVSSIDTSNDLPSSDLPSHLPIMVGSHPTAMFLNNNANQLFTANSAPSSNSISVINVAVPQPTVPPVTNPNFGQTTTINLPSSCTLQTSSTTSKTVTVAVSNVVATPDGNRAYVLSTDGAGDACVFLVSLLDNQVVMTPVLTGAFSSSTSYLFTISSDGTKVYVVAEQPSGVAFTSGGAIHSANIASISTTSTITTINNITTSTNNTFAPMSVPQQSVATPAQVIPQP